jgi:hypothetical protein
VPTDRFDKSALPERCPLEPTEPHFEIRVRKGRHERPIQGSFQHPGLSARDPHGAHTAFHDPVDLIRARALWWQTLWWQTHGSTPLRPPRSFAALEGRGSRNHTFVLDLRDEVDRGSHPEGASGRLPAMTARAHEPPRLHPLVRLAGAACQSMARMPRAGLWARCGLTKPCHSTKFQEMRAVPHPPGGRAEHSAQTERPSAR